jgi:hypothetical protein
MFSSLDGRSWQVYPGASSGGADWTGSDSSSQMYWQPVWKEFVREEWRDDRRELCSEWEELSRTVRRYL